MWIDGVSAEVTSVGPRPDFVGIDRISARIPAELFGRNEVDVWVTADGMTSNRLRVSLAAP
jgi:uncharacterized protein (TIGR03437 family)